MCLCRLPVSKLIAYIKFKDSNNLSVFLQAATLLLWKIQRLILYFCKIMLKQNSVASLEPHFSLSTHLFFRTCCLPIILSTQHLISPNVHFKYKKPLSFWSDKGFLFSHSDTDIKYARSTLLFLSYQEAKWNLLREKMLSVLSSSWF